MKTVLKIILGIVVVIIVAVGAVFYFTGDLVDSADEFFEAVKSGDVAKARNYLSEEFKANTDEGELREFLSSNAFLNFKEVAWGERSIKTGGRGKLDGTITTESGGSAPIKLEFVKENDSWRIYSMSKPRAGLAEQPEGPQFPSEQVQVQLVADAMHIFGESVNNKSMAKFYEYISTLWQRQTSVEELNKVFAGFYEWGGDLTVVDNLAPIFDQPVSIGEDGSMLIKGHYQTKPKFVVFELRYIYEGLGWKMIGIKVNVE